MDRPITLLIPEKTDEEFEQVFATWTQSGGQIKRLGKYWIKDEELAKQKIAIYGSQAFAFVLAQIYNVELPHPWFVSSQTTSFFATCLNCWNKKCNKTTKIYSPVVCVLTNHTELK